MRKSDFLQLLGQAYAFPDYYAQNLDSADEILEDRKEAEETKRLSLRPLFEALLREEPAEERAKIWALIRDHFGVV